MFDSQFRTSSSIPNRVLDLHPFTGNCFWGSPSSVSMPFLDICISFSKTVRGGRPHKQLWRERMEDEQWWWRLSPLGKALQTGWETRRSLGGVCREWRVWCTPSLQSGFLSRAAQCVLFLKWTAQMEAVSKRNEQCFFKMCVHGACVLYTKFLHFLEVALALEHQKPKNV